MSPQTQYSIQYSYKYYYLSAYKESPLDKCNLTSEHLSMHAIHEFCPKK